MVPFGTCVFQKGPVVSLEAVTDVVRASANAGGSSKPMPFLSMHSTDSQAGGFTP